MSTHPLSLQSVTEMQVSYELSCKAVPYKEVIKLFSSLPYGHVVRVGFAWAFVTFCRPSELARFQFNGQDSFLKGNWYYWRVGKNQKGQWRREWISDELLQETKYYIEHNRVPYDRVIGISAETLGRYFNKYVRPQLGPEWQQRCAVRRQRNISEFVLQFKGLRKSGACLYFWQQFKKWKDAGAALERTAARMHHSTAHITANHYLQDLETLDIEEWGDYTPCEILSLAYEQKKLTSFDLAFNKRLGVDNRQSRLLDFSAW